GHEQVAAEEGAERDGREERPPRHRAREAERGQAPTPREPRDPQRYDQVGERARGAACGGRRGRPEEDDRDDPGPRATSGPRERGREQGALAGGDADHSQRSWRKRYSAREQQRRRDRARERREQPRRRVSEQSPAAWPPGLVERPHADSPTGSLPPAWQRPPRRGSRAAGTPASPRTRARRRE